MTNKKIALVDPFGGAKFYPLGDMEVPFSLPAFRQAG